MLYSHRILETGLLRIGELSKRTGVSPELLRAWERRYGLRRPHSPPGVTPARPHAPGGAPFALRPSARRLLAPPRGASLRARARRAVAARRGLDRTGAFR